jgi:hypothetical protein
LWFAESELFFVKKLLESLATGRVYSPIPKFLPLKSPRPPIISFSVKELIGVSALREPLSS